MGEPTQARTPDERGHAELREDAPGVGGGSVTWGSEEEEMTEGGDDNVGWRSVGSLDMELELLVRQERMAEDTVGDEP